MNREELVEYLLKNPSVVIHYKQKRVAEQFKLDYKFVLECFAEVREKMKGEGSEVQKQVDKGGERLLEYLKEHGLTLSDVQRIKIYGDTDNPMFSIHTKDEWYREQKDFFDKLNESIKGYVVPDFIPINDPIGETLAVINLYDAHIDRITLIDETNPSGSVEENVARFEDAFDKLLTKTLVHSPEIIVFPVGNDFFNANDDRNTTKRGTPQDSSPFWKQSFIKGYECIRRCIDKAAKYAKVEVKLVISNHDEDKLFYFGQLLKATYERCPTVVVDDSTKARKFMQYGVTLLGFSHGDKEKKYIQTLPATIMIENKMRMPDIKFIHHFCGDIHHQEKYITLSSQDLKGCTISFLRPMCDLSKWEYEEGYIGIPKTAESYVFKKEKGLEANILVHI